MIENEVPSIRPTSPPGLVSLVGAGPGDPGLITVSGLRRLQEADVVVYDRLAGQELLNRTRAGAETVYVGKQPRRHTLSQDEINDLLVDRARRGFSVCRLKGGDPLVFGRGGEEAIACLKAGVPFEIIPGITSAIAAPAYAGIPVTHRLVATSFAVVTGHEDPGRVESSIRWEHLSRGVDTLVFLMGVERIEEITTQLVAHGRPGSTPAALVQWGATSNQRVLISSVSEIAARSQEEQIKPPAVLVIGEVVALREQLQWFDNRPLSGKRVVVTRAREQASDLVRLLTDRGAAVIEAPMIRIRPYTLTDQPAFNLKACSAADWVVFTSVNAVHCFFNLINEAGGDSRSVGAARIAAVGPVTAAAVEEHGLRVDYVPGEALGRRIAEEFPEPLTDLKLLIPRALEAPDELISSLEKAGGEVTVVPVYETVAETESPELREKIAAGEVDYITFTSSSTVMNFLRAVPAACVPAAVQVVCIGPRTAETAASAGLRVDVIAEPHTVVGVAGAVERLAGE